jgi:hypothetical protein
MTMYSWTANQQGQNMLQLQFSIIWPFNVHAISLSFSRVVGDHPVSRAALQADRALSPPIASRAR